MPRKSNMRNAQGSGTIRQRPDGRWEARYSAGRDPGTGKQIQKSVYGKIQKEAAEKLRKVTAAIDDGTYSEPSKFTVSQWLDIWHKEYIGNVKPATVTSYEQQIRNHIKPAFGAMKLIALHPATIQKCYNALQAGGLSPKSIRNVHGVLHRALEQAVMLGYIRTNPASICTLPRVEKPEMKPLDSGEMETFLNTIKGHRLESLFYVAMFTGAREGELLALQWSCVDFDRGTILIDKQLLRPRKKGERYRFGPPKNDKPRTITPAPAVMKALKDHRHAQNQHRLRAGGAWDVGDFPNLVFTTELGRYQCFKTVLKDFQKAITTAGLEERRFHDLRHTYAVSSLRAGDDVKTVQGNLGHATAAFTLDQYGHVTETMKHDSAARMQAFIMGLNKK